MIITNNHGKIEINLNKGKKYIYRKGFLWEIIAPYLLFYKHLKAVEKNHKKPLIPLDLHKREMTRNDEFDQPEIDQKSQTAF